MPQNRPAEADSTDRRNYRPRNDLRLAVFTIVYNPPWLNRAFDHGYSVPSV